MIETNIENKKYIKFIVEILLRLRRNKLFMIKPFIKQIKDILRCLDVIDFIHKEK